MANICGDCRAGFQGASGPSNEICQDDVGAAASEASMRPKKRKNIKINGIRVNPQAKAQGPSPAVPEPIDLFQPTSTTNDIQSSSDRHSVIAEAAADPKTEIASDTEPEATAPSTPNICPLNSYLVGPSHCECLPGYGLDPLGQNCVLSVGMPSAAQALSSSVDLSPLQPERSISA